MGDVRSISQGILDWAQSPLPSANPTPTPQKNNHPPTYLLIKPGGEAARVALAQDSEQVGGGAPAARGHEAGHHVGEELLVDADGAARPCRCQEGVDAVPVC